MEQPSPRTGTERYEHLVRASARAAAVVSEQARQRWDAKAQKAGYPDIAALLADTTGRPAAHVVALVGGGLSNVANLRARYAPRPEPQEPGARWARQARRHGIDPNTPDLDWRTIPPGVQPEWAGKLLCGMCFRWFRGLGQHVVRKHGISADDYKRIFELPTTFGLVGEPLRQVLAENARYQLATNDAIRRGITNTAEALAERRILALATKQETGSRAGVRASVLERAHQVGKLSAQRARARRADLDQRAREAGYRDLPSLLGKTSHLTMRQVGQLLGCSDGMAAYWRYHFGIASTARQHAQTKRVKTQRALLKTIPKGSQPTKGGLLVCLEWAQPKADLALHLSKTHQMASAVYRKRHRLPAEAALVLAELTERRIQSRLGETVAPHGDS